MRHVGDSVVDIWLVVSLCLFVLSWLHVIFMFCVVVSDVFKMTDDNIAHVLSRFLKVFIVLHGVFVDFVCFYCFLCIGSFKGFLLVC